MRGFIQKWTTFIEIKQKEFLIYKWILNIHLIKVKDRNCLSEFNIIIGA